MSRKIKKPMLLTTMFLLVLTGCSGGSSTIEEKSTELKEEVTDTVESIDVEIIDDATKDAVEEAEQSANDAIDAAEDAAEEAVDAVDDVKEVVEEIGN